jgi:hypothetical protein
MDKLTHEIIGVIPEDTHIDQLAHAIADVVEIEYGAHNVRQFVEIILQRLGEELSAKMAMQILRDKGYYSSNLWHIDDVINNTK